MKYDLLMAHVILEPPVKLWICPSCGGEHQTKEARPHVPMHSCPALHGCSVPFVEKDGLKSRHVVVEREDFVGNNKNEILNYVNGRPVMAVRTEREDGSNDLHAFAPTAVMRIE